MSNQTSTAQRNDAAPVFGPYCFRFRESVKEVISLQDVRHVAAGPRRAVKRAMAAWRCVFQISAPPTNSFVLVSA
jgi:hypothetical protein